MVNSREERERDVYLDVVDRMNILHGFFDDLSHLSNALMRPDCRDGVPMDENVTIGQQFNRLQDRRHIREETKDRLPSA